MTKLQDAKIRLNNLYQIVDYKGDKVPFKLNKSQRITLEAFLKYKRIVVLKGRQAGLTTLGTIVATDMANFIPNSSSLIVPHNNNLAKLVFKKCRQSYKDLYDKSGGKIYEGDKFFELPDTVYFNTSEMELANEASVRIALDATGSSLTHLHMTEASRNTNAEEVFISAMSALNEGTCIVEGTAWGTVGEGKWFYDFYNDSRAGKTGFHAIFLAWHYEDRYEKECITKSFPPHIEEVRQFLGDYPKEQQDRKLQWYYDMSLIQKGKMKQEFPNFPEEAFLSTGNSVFSLARINELRQDPLYYDWDEVYGKYSKDVDEGLRIYRPAEVGCRISIDPAGGNEKGDYTALIVRNSSRQLLAHYYGKAGPDKTYAILRRLEELGYIGTIVPELNATNGGAVMTLIKRGIDDREIEGELYRRDRSEEDIKNGIATKYGWDTNSKTRKLIIEHYELIFEREVLNEIDDRQLHEMANFYENDNGKKIASDDEHDDAIICDAIGLYTEEIGSNYMTGSSSAKIL